MFYQFRLQQQIHYIQILMNSSDRQSSHSSSSLSPSQRQKPKPKIPIILSYKIKQCISTWRIRAKKSKHRWNVLNEWAETQKNYIRDLRLIIEKIQKPMIEKQIISEGQEAILFRNIDTIIQLSEQILLVLEGFINKKNWRPAVIEISTVLLKLHPFLKIYIQYCNHYYKGQNILKAVKNLPDMIMIEKSLPMDVDSYLIKPIQRPPKYMLLLKDYKKHLPQNHPDYKNLCEAIDKYHEVNQINNNAIAQQSKVAKMVYLQKLYTEAMQSNREYIRQFDATIYKTTVKVYVLTDLFIVTEIVDYKETVYKIIHMDHNSFLHHPPDGKYFFNILFICGKYETIHLMFDTDKELRRQHHILNKLLNQLELKESNRRKIMVDKKQEHQVVKVPVTLAQKKQNNTKFQSYLRITVDGVEKRPISTFKSETYYIIKYQMPKPWSFYKLNYTRYSTIEEIFNYMKKHFPQLLLPDLNPDIFNVGIYDQTKNKTQIMEYRCMAIEEFLNRIFRWEKVMANPIFLLETLKVDNNIWQFAINKKSCRCPLCQQQRNIRSTIQYFISRRNKFYLNKQNMGPNHFCMCNYAVDEYNMPKLSLKYFNTIEKIYCYLNAVDGKTQEFRMLTPPAKDKQELKVTFINMTKQHTVTVQINSYSSVGEVLRKVGKSIGIKFFGDFGLFVKYSGIPKLLDTDQRIYDVLNNIQSDQNEKSGPTDDGFFSTLKQGINIVKKWGQEMMFGKKSKLVIKKYLFFPTHLESQAYKEDSVRYNLLIEQAFYGVYSETIILTDKQFIAVCAIFICMKSSDKLIHIKRGYFPIDTLMRILPSSKRSLAQTTKWMQDLIKKIDQFKEYVLCQPSQMSKLQEYLLQIVEDKISWDAMIANMTNYQPSTLDGSPFNIQVGVSHKHLFVVPPKSDKLLLQIPLQVLEYKVTPFSIFIQLNDCKYRFDGKMLYNLKKIIQKYRKFQQTFGEVLNCVNSSLYQSKYVSMKSMRF